MTRNAPLGKTRRATAPWRRVAFVHLVCSVVARIPAHPPPAKRGSTHARGYDGGAGSGKDRRAGALRMTDAQTGAEGRCSGVGVEARVRHPIA